MAARSNLFMLLVGLGLASGYAAPVSAQTPATESVRLEETSWDGQETLAGYGALTFRFHDEGFVTMVDADGESLGTWRQAGLAVTLFFSNGNVVYRGTISNDSMSGVARNSRSVWRWQVSRE